MNYDELVSTALKRKEIKKLLCGEKPYEVEMSKFTSDVFPNAIKPLREISWELFQCKVV